MPSIADFAAAVDRRGEAGTRANRDEPAAVDRGVTLPASTARSVDLAAAVDRRRKLRAGRESRRRRGSGRRRRSRHRARCGLWMSDAQVIIARAMPSHTSISVGRRARPGSACTRVLPATMVTRCTGPGRSDHVAAAAQLDRAKRRNGNVLGGEHRRGNGKSKANSGTSERMAKSPRIFATSVALQMQRVQHQVARWLGIAAVGRHDHASSAASSAPMSARCWPASTSRACAYEVDPITPFYGNDEFRTAQPAAAHPGPDRRRCRAAAILR